MTCADADPVVYWGYGHHLARLPRLWIADPPRVPQHRIVRDLHPRRPRQQHRFVLKGPAMYAIDTDTGRVLSDSEAETAASNPAVFRWVEFIDTIPA